MRPPTAQALRYELEVGLDQTQRPRCVGTPRRKAVRMHKVRADRSSNSCFMMRMIPNSAWGAPGAKVRSGMRAANSCGPIDF